MEHLEKTGRPFRLAIDISIWQFQIQSGQGGKNPALRTLYYRLIKLLGLSIQPLFVFDGPSRPQFKRNVKINLHAASLDNFLTTELLRKFGFLCHDAPGEAEAECALLQKEGIVDAVLSEDVDTIMFGCGMSLRNWTAEGTRGNKGPTHVNVYTEEATRNGAAGLDSEGMILIALMSGGDYITAGIPRCGIKTACRAARAGFGHHLCQLAIDDHSGLKDWRQNLQHELQTNQSNFFRQKHKALTIPDDFPDQLVLGYYKRPVISSTEKVSRLREELQWNQDVNVQELRSFVAEAFKWPYLSGAKHFIRGLAPALLAHKLINRSKAEGSADESLECKAATEYRYVKAVSGRRIHWNTDGAPELRIAYVPAEIVGLDLDCEENGDVAEFTAQDASDAEQADYGGESKERSRSPTKRKGISAYDPTQVERVWVLETYAKLGVPLLVETWEEEMRNPKKFATRKAREKTVMNKGGMKRGAMEQFVKILKPGVGQGLFIPPNGAKQTDDRALPPIFLAPATATEFKSPQRRALSENRTLVGSGVQQKTFERVKTTKTENTKRLTNKAPVNKSPNKKANPWTLARRPSDTIGIRSPTRYSALGIYGPDDPELQEPHFRGPGRADRNSQQRLASPPTSPSPRKKHSRPDSFSSDQSGSLSFVDPTPRPVEDAAFTLPDTVTLRTPSRRDSSKPSPKKKLRSPLETANDLYRSGQLRTPTSMRKEGDIIDLVDDHGAAADEDDNVTEALGEDRQLTARKVNRRLDFTAWGKSPGGDSPASDTSSLPSPSTLLSPQRERTGTVGGKDAGTADGVVSSKAQESKVRRLVALRESLEGTWKHLEPWEVDAAKKVFSSVEVLDLTGS